MRYSCVPVSGLWRMDYRTLSYYYWYPHTVLVLCTSVQGEQGALEAMLRPFPRRSNFDLWVNMAMGYSSYATVDSILLTVLLGTVVSYSLSYLSFETSSLIAHASTKTNFSQLIRPICFGNEHRRHATCSVICRLSTLVLVRLSSNHVPFN